jgi:hypothetical protein
MFTDANKKINGVVCCYWNENLNINDLLKLLLKKKNKIAWEKWAFTNKQTNENGNGEIVWNCSIFINSETFIGVYRFIIKKQKKR